MQPSNNCAVTLPARGCAQPRHLLVPDEAPGVEGLRLRKQLLQDELAGAPAGACDRHCQLRVHSSHCEQQAPRRRCLARADSWALTEGIADA